MKKGVDYIGVGVGAAIVSPSRKLFLIKRGKKVRNEVGKWDFPGGGVEFGETLEQAIIREVMEEHGIIIEPVELLDVCDHIIPNEGQHWVAPTFMAKLASGEPKIMEPEKCDEIGWFSLLEVENLDLAISTAENLGDIREKYPDGLPDFYVKAGAHV